MVATLTPQRRNQNDLLRSARVALQSGLDLAAGVTARIALEAHVKLLCQSHNCKPCHERAGAREYVVQLYKERHITKATKLELDLVLKICNRCAHNEGVAWNEIVYAIGAVRDFMQIHNLPPWWEEVFPSES